VPIQSLIKFRSDTAANWTSTNPTLAQGELGFETDTGKPKIGDGMTVWTSLDYIAGKYTLDQLSNISTSSPLQNNVLAYDSVGSNFTNQTSSEANIGSSLGYRFIEKVVYTSSTTLTPAANIRAMNVIAIGGGGGSGGAAVGAVSAGSSGGNFAESFLYFDSQNAPYAKSVVPSIGSVSISIVVGAGGSAGGAPGNGVGGGSSSFFITVADAITRVEESDNGEILTLTFANEYKYLLLDGYIVVGSCIGMNDSGVDDDLRADAILVDEVDLVAGTMTVTDSGQNWDGTKNGSFDLTIYYCRAQGGKGGLGENALTAPDFEGGTVAVDNDDFDGENQTYGDWIALGGSGQFAAYETTADFYHAKPGASAMFPITEASIARTTASAAGYSARSTDYGAGAFGAVNPPGNAAAVAGGAGTQGVVIVEYYA